MSADNTITISAATLDELNKMIADLIAQGWHTDSEPTNNSDGTFSATMIRK